MPNTDLVRASRDGDQFHYLWAARRCLRLLLPDSGLVAISIEGSSPNELAGDEVVDAGEQLIDVAEYFGSEDIKKAQLVRYVQLKHSTARASTPWTASGLEKTIKGFAKRYQELLQICSIEELSVRLQFCFVTNRPISSDFLKAVADVATSSNSHDSLELEKLRQFTGLSGNALSMFSRLLRFEGGEDNYWDQRNILFQEVSSYLTDADADAPTLLKELVTRRALSEGNENPVITKIDVLRALNTDEGILFPARSQINTPDAAIPRTQEAALIRSIVESHAPVIVHAPAGVGKTVFGARIAKGLPEGSEYVLYDCFGNGQYRSASGYRHRHRDALVQIANELAARSFCHPLIPTSRADNSMYVKAFLHRLEQASTLMNLANPQGLLCITIDAADNAQMASEEIGEARSFVRDLIREQVPDNVRLVFLCRSHRQACLDPPVATLRLELEPFNLQETAAHLRQKFKDASDHDINEFHRLSSHNPRVQALSLSQDNSLSETLRLLGPNPTSVDDTIGNLLEGAIANLRDSTGSIEKAQLDKIFAGLAALRPLIPIPILSQISGVDEGAIKSFAIDLGRPLLLDGDTVQFLDEPAETWFRERFRPSAGAMHEFIEALKPLAASSAYAAAVLPQLLLEAGKFPELVGLALESTALPETSPLEKRDVELQRLQFALKASLRTKRYLDAAKLSLKAGGEMAGDDRRRAILQSNTDLASLFLETDLIQELVSRRTFGSGWLGSHHAYEAALLSGRQELTGDARSRLRMAYEWLRNWRRLSSEERENEEISDEDIVELTLANINIHGPESGAHELQRWRPREVSYRAGKAVARILIDHARFDDIETLSRAAGNNLCLVLAIAVELREVQRTLPIDVTRRAVRMIANSRVKLPDERTWNIGESVVDAVVAIVELGLQSGECAPTTAVEILSRYLPDEPPRGHLSRFLKTRNMLLRAYCLRAALLGQEVELRDLAHEELRIEIDKAQPHSTSRDLQEFQEEIGALLPWHQLWVSTLLGNVTVNTFDGELKRTLKASKEAERIHHRDDFHIADEIAVLWSESLHHLEGEDENALTALLRWKDERKRPLYTATLTSIARLFSQREWTKAVALKLALEAFHLTKDERADAETESVGYINAARAILSVSRADAAAYFNEAVEVASKIGDENLARWDSILDLADRSARFGRSSPEIAYHFARCAELTYAYVLRDKYFNWEATIKALCGLCPVSAFTILSRWRDRHFGWMEEILPIAVNELVAHGGLDARDALPLIGFRAHWNYGQLLDDALTKCATVSEKRSVAAHLVRYVQMTGGDYSGVKKSADKHGLSIPGLELAIALAKTNKSAKETQTDHQEGIVSVSGNEDARDWDAVFSGHDLGEANGLSSAYGAFKGTEPPWDHDHFFSEAVARLPVGSEPAFIEAVASVPELGLYDLRNLLEQVPSSWRDRPATRHALVNTLRSFCRRHCMEVTRNRFFQVLPLKTACSLAGIEEDEIVGVVLDAIGEAPDIVDSGRLFSLVGLLAVKLTEDEALEALSFGLDLYGPVLEDSDGDGPWSNDLHPPTDLTAAVAGYVWGAMAAPEAVTRWEGAHVVSGLTALGRQGVLSHLFGFACEGNVRPFVDGRLRFYALHAFQWFLIGIARSANVSPEILLPFADQILSWAQEDQPHILIRLLAARAALALLDYGVLAENLDVRNSLAAFDESPFPPVDSKTADSFHTATQALEPVDEEDRYYFGMDLGPYWFAPLGRVFGLSEAQVESAALKTIREEFGEVGRGRWVEDERAKRGLYEESHTLHSHGSYPRTDALDFYHAYHAMMIVAGRLLASTPIHRDSDRNTDHEFRDWLDGHDTSRRDGRWLWDRRDTAPSDVSNWEGSDGNRDIGHRIHVDELSEALSSGGMLNVWGKWTVANSKFEQSTRIRSALVPTDRSAALLRALSTADSFHDYALPSAGSDMEIEEAGFSLRGWVVDDSSDRGIEDMDRWAGGIDFPPPRPAREIIDAMTIDADVDFRFWKDRELAAVMASQVWGHYDEALRNQRTDPERGRRLQASPDFLMALLAKLDRDMILEVQIDRQRRHRPYKSDFNDDEERIPAKAKLYVLGADGRLRTIEGGLGPRT